MKFELYFDNNCLDLPSLTKIQGSNSWNIHCWMGHVILESMIWFDLIWFYKTFQISLKTTLIMEMHHLNILPICKQQVLFISFPFSRFRCSCSRKLHSRNAESNKMAVVILEKTAFLPLAERRKEKSSSAVVEIVVCFVLLNFRYLFDCNQFQPFSQSNREGVSSSLTNAKNHTLSMFLSRVSQIVVNKQISNLFPHFSFSTILKSKRRNKTKQNQNILCKCGWDFDYFDQFDQNHAFSNHNQKRMTIGFALR